MTEAVRTRSPRRCHGTVDGAGAVAEVGAEVALEDHRAVARQASRDAVKDICNGSPWTPQGDDARRRLTRRQSRPVIAVTEERGRGVGAGRSGSARTIRSRAPVSVRDESRRLRPRVRVDGEAAVGRYIERCHELGGVQKRDLPGQLVVEVEVRGTCRGSGCGRTGSRRRGGRGRRSRSPRWVLIGDHRHGAQQQVLDRGIAVADDGDVGGRTGRRAAACWHGGRGRPRGRSPSRNARTRARGAVRPTGRRSRSTARRRGSSASPAGSA